MSTSAEQQRVFSLVPGAAPIELVAFYPEFTDYYPESELQTKRWLVQNAGTDWVTLDVGANVGVYSMLMSRLSPEGHVHAFEPTATAELLRKNLAAQGIGNVTVRQVAMGNQAGMLDESIYRIWGAAPERQHYDFNTLDRFVTEAGLARVDCIKIDVDGFDLEVLKGAEKTLERFNPWVIIELNHALATRGQSVGDAMLWLLARGYNSALVLDQENFILKREPSDTAGPVDRLSLTFDREPILLPPVFGPGEPLPAFFSPVAKLHNGAVPVPDHPGALQIPGPRWSYGASWSREGAQAAGSIIVEAEIEVSAGAVGLGCLASDLTVYVGKEMMIHAAPGPQMVRLFVPQAETVEALMLRNVTEGGEPARAEIHSVRVFTARPAAVTASPVLDPRVRSFDLNECLANDGTTARGQRQIRIVPVGELGDALDLKAPYVPERMVYRYGIDRFKTEVDEPGIYRYLYKHLSPRRHLEFGTWEGFGTVLCAQSCAAEIWTINLPEGERDEQGNPLYGRQALDGETLKSAEHGQAGDAGERIGWRYRAAGYSDRVHQILCDSREFRAEEFAPEFFDTILVDGGHTPEVVMSDTDKAIPLLRSGGVMIWHDFCPDPAALAASEAGQGVMRAIVDNYDRWRPHFSQVFWVRPSWLLIGVKA